MIYNLYYYSYFLLIPAILLSLWAQMRVSRTFKKASRFYTGMTGSAAARAILSANGLSDVKIERVRGHLTDHYDPSANVIRLSDSVYDSNTAAAVGVAAHEAGHAIQYATHYGPIKLRAAIIPACSMGSRAAMPMFLLGILMSRMGMIGNSLGYGLMLVGIMLYSLAVLFQMVTLPVEFDASRRAVRALEGGRHMGDSELAQSRRVLSAAAMTYVAALVTSLLSLLRLIMLAGSRRR